jgi:hypothetical protein
MTVLLTSLAHVLVQVLPQRGDSYSTGVKTEARRLFMDGAVRGKLPATSYYQQGPGRIFNNLPDYDWFRLGLDNP